MDTKSLARLPLWNGLSLTLHWEWNLWQCQPTEQRRNDNANFQKWAFRDWKSPFLVPWNTRSWSLKCHGRSSASLLGRTPGDVCNGQLEIMWRWTQISPAFQPKPQVMKLLGLTRPPSCHMDTTKWSQSTSPGAEKWPTQSCLNSWSIQLRDITKWLC